MRATPLDDLRGEVAAGREDGVAYCDRLLGPSLPAGWAGRRRAQLASGDTEELISAAEDITRRLGGPDGGEYLRWLTHSVGQLAATRPEAVHALAGLGIPLATTNYDGLLEAATGLPAVTCREGARVEQVLRGERKAVMHLHGYWEDAASVVLGIRSYEAVLGDAHAEAMRKALAATRTLVFVGCGAGLADPNFTELRRWFVRCNAATTGEAVLAEVAAALGLPVGPDLAGQALAHLARASAVVVLDNAETPWWADAAGAEEAFRAVGAVPGVALVASLRGRQRPLGLAWRDAINLTPLATPEARKVFLAVAGQSFQDDPRLDALVGAQDGLPLTTTLLAYQAEGEPSLGDCGAAGPSVGSPCWSAAEAATTSAWRRGSTCRSTASA